MANSLLPIQPDRGEPLITLPPSSDRAAEARVVAWFLSTEPDNIVSQIVNFTRFPKNYSIVIK